MTHEIYHCFLYGGIILVGIMLIVSVVLFFYLKIPNVTEDLTENIQNEREHPLQVKWLGENTALKPEDKTAEILQEKNIFEIEHEVTFIHTNEVIA